MVTGGRAPSGTLSNCLALQESLSTSSLSRLSTVHLLAAGSGNSGECAPANGTAEESLLRWGTSTAGTLSNHVDKEDLGSDSTAGLAVSILNNVARVEHRGDQGRPIGVTGQPAEVEQ